MILVTFAVPQESRDFRRAIAGRDADGEEIRIAHVGMGEAAAAKRIARLLADEKPRLLICAGFGGGLDERLQVADIVIAENESSPELLVPLRGTPGILRSRDFFGTLVTQGTTAETAAAKKELAQRSGAMVVDMETAAVSAACRVAGVPMLAIRSISDTLSTEIPLPLEVCYDLERQRSKAFGVVKYLLTHPSRIGPFIRFLRDLAPASRALADFLIRFLAVNAEVPTDATSPAPKRPRWRRILTRTAFSGAVLAILVAAFFFEENIRGSIVWNRYQAEAKARGVKLTLEDFVPPPIPDEQNFAAIPVFQDAFRDPQPPNPFALPQEVDNSVPWKDRIKPPLWPVSFYQGDPIDLAAWQKYFVQTKVLPAAGENPAQDILRALERYAPQFEQLRLAGKRPGCRFPVRYELVASAPLPHLALLMSASKLYALRLAAHLALGQNDAAYEDFAGALRLHQATIREPTLIAGLVRLSELSTLYGTVWCGLARHQWSAANLEKIETALAQLQLLDEYALSYESERGFINQMSENYCRMGFGEKRSVALTLRNAGVLKESENWMDWGFILGPKGWIRLDQTRGNRHLDAILSGGTQNPPRIDPDRFWIDLAAEKEKAGFWGSLKYHSFFDSASVMQNVARNFAFSQTLLDESRLGCVLERYRIEHRRLPDSLEALRSGFLNTLPYDVMTGEPLHYQPMPDGSYTLYSVGWNRRDDGGKPDPSVKSLTQQPDWVWRIPAFPPENQLPAKDGRE